jgi:hypothetical protein
MQHKKKIQLEDLEKKQVYTVPENYFENLPANIRRRTNTSRHSVKPSFSWARYSAGLAGLFLVLLAGYLWFTRSQARTPDQLIAELAYSEIIDYLQTQELSQADIIEIASDAGITFESQPFRPADINSELLLEEADAELLQEYM